MVSLLMYLFFLIPVLYLGSWWLVFLFLVLGFFFFLNSFWFLSFYSMISYSLGGDLLSMCMIFLSLWIVLLMILASYMIYSNSNYYIEFMLVNLFLLIFLIFSFCTTNLFLFYLFFESSLIPTLFLIFGWGYQPERLSAGFYLLFYTLFASLPLLITIFMIDSFCGTLYYFIISLDCNFYIYVSLILAFLVKMPMIFVHFWLPKAHVEAPISGSMILAGVLLKLGGYGLMRVFNFIFDYSINYNYLFIGLSLFGSLLVGVLCLYQIDIKSLIAYSSVAHMGLVICGIFTLNFWGLCGSLILMIGHGLCSSGLFCLANIIYERVHSRSFMINKGLISFMPSLSLFWFILSSNNMASPPSLNLLGEIMLINSVMSWSIISFMFLGLSSFLSCCYSIYLYSYVQHGSFFSGLGVFKLNSLREYVLILFHILPLNIIVLKSDIFVLWL
uniref:NADH-ubiquinone oxidoreductase chain 4 n=1 Tax=Acanthaspis cincticrus TaxID=1911546 RepID=A0A343W8Q8_9HEMI|nr:NADH dehydrogenase subunit 4 [Acanthaspis cincticrus]AVZ00748.1 NADH dehydrogenase subunit 4 [Acanthaspis cincticrus]